MKPLLQTVEISDPLKASISAVANADMPIDQKILMIMAKVESKECHVTLRIPFVKIESIYNSNPMQWDTTIYLYAIFKSGKDYARAAGHEEQLVLWARYNNLKAYVDWKNETVAIMNQFQQFADYTSGAEIEI